MNYGRSYHGFPMESKSVHPFINTLADTTSDMEAFLRASAPENPQISTEIQSTSIPANINKGAGPAHHESPGIRGPLDAMSFTTFPGSPTLFNALYMPSMLVSRGPMPVPVISTEDKACNDSLQSTLHGIPSTPTTVQYQEQRESRGCRQQVQETGNNPATVSSTPPGQQSNGPYPCKLCDKTFAQPQGVTRHHREAHKPTLCRYCRTFKASRPYRYREHLERHHPAALEETKRSGPKATYVPQEHASLSTPKHDQRHAVSPPALPAAGKTELLPISAPVLSPVDQGHDLQLHFADPTNTKKRKWEDASPLEVLDSSHPPSPFPEERCPIVKDLDKSARSVPTRLRRLPPKEYACYQPLIPSGVPTPTPSVSGYHNNPIYAIPVGPSRPPYFPRIRRHL